jgi:hypothetical protein
MNPFIVGAIDEETVHYRALYKAFVADNLRSFYELDELYVMNGKRFLLNINDWMDMDEYTREAYRRVLVEADYSNRQAQEQYANKTLFEQQQSYGNLGAPNINNLRF